MADAADIPDKLYFRIGEVSELTGVKPHVLRYWESEFNIVTPTKSQSNQRLYDRKEVELILEIKKLLYDEGYTIAGVKGVLEKRSKEKNEKQLSIGFVDQEKYKEVLRKVRQEILSLKKMVEQ